MAGMTHSTMNTLFALAVGSHDLASCQRKKYLLPSEKSGCRSFRKSSCGETNVIQNGTLLSQISFHSPSPRSVWSLSLSTVAKCLIGRREQEYCQSTTIRGPKKRGYCVTKCAGNPFQKKLHNKMNKYKSAVGESNNSNNHQSGTKRNQSSNNFIEESDPKRLKNGDTPAGSQPQNSEDQPSAENQNTQGESNSLASMQAGSQPQNSDNQQLQEMIGAVIKSNINDLAVKVDLEIKGGQEHVLKIKGFTSTSSTEEDKVERAKQMAQKAAVLLLYGEMLLDIGRKLHDQSRESLYSIYERPAPPNSESVD